MNGINSIDIIFNITIKKLVVSETSKVEKDAIEIAPSRRFCTR